MKVGKCMSVMLVILMSLTFGCTGSDMQKAVSEQVISRTKRYYISNDLLSDIAVNKIVYKVTNTQKEEGKDVTYVKGYVEFSGKTSSKFPSSSGLGQKVTFWVVFRGVAYKNGYGETAARDIELKNVISKSDLKIFDM